MDSGQAKLEVPRNEGGPEGKVCGIVFEKKLSPKLEGVMLLRLRLDPVRYPVPHVCGLPRMPGVFAIVLFGYLRHKRLVNYCKMVTSAPVAAALRCFLVVTAQFLSHVLDSSPSVPLEKSLRRVQQEMPVPRLQHTPFVIDWFALFPAVHEPKRVLVTCDSRPHPSRRLFSAQDASNVVHNLDAVRIALCGSPLNEKMASIMFFL